MKRTSKRSPRDLVLFSAALAGVALVGCDRTDDLFCSDAGCGFTKEEWRSLAALADLPEAPPPDPSNRYVGNRAAEILGQKLFFDARWSGPSTQVDALRRPMTYARAAKGQPTNISCASCHNMRRGGIDTESQPGHISIGAGWSDANATSVYNAAYYDIQHWNGRADSLWAQAVAATEGAAMNGNRLNLLYSLSEWYRAEFNAVFVDHQLPALSPRKEVEGLLAEDGVHCKPVNNACAAPCREARNADTGAVGCFPRFPLAGKPGNRTGCQPDDAGEPWGDAFDCMDEKDQEPVTRALVNYAKAIAAYEYRLVSRDAAFDRFVKGVADKAPRTEGSFSAAAERGARLFVGKAACTDCHNTPLLSDSKFHNIGVAQIGVGVPTEADCPAGGVCDCVTVTPDRMGNNCLPWGALDGLDKLSRNRFRRDLKWSDDPQDTSHKAYLERRLEPRLKGAYRTPSLRDVAMTAPYMHNGSLPTLEAVIDHYNRGGMADAPGARSAQIKPLYLSDTEKADLVAFLRTLTGAPLPDELITPLK